MLSGLKELIEASELAGIEDPEETLIISNLDCQTSELRSAKLQGNWLNLDYLREETTSDSSLMNGYGRVDNSELLPDLNIALLSECTLIVDRL